MALIIPIFIAHRGCPHQCLFCNQHAIAGSSGDPDIGTEISSWLRRSRTREEVQVAFYGGSFTCLAEEEQQRLLAPVQPFIEKGLVRSIRISTRPDCITDHNCRMLSAMGVATVELGVQSLDDQVLRLARRGHTADDSRRAMHILRSGGLRVGVQLLPGLPGETTRSFMAGVAEVVAFAPELVRLYPAVVVKKSPLAEMVLHGEYRPLSLNRAVALTGRAKERFDAAGIPVVRMGLQPTAELDQSVVAGPYHPAFGELVASRLWFRQLRQQLRNLAAGERLRVHISDRDHSAVAGAKRINILRLKQLGYGGRFSIHPEKGRKRGSVSYVVC